MIRYDVCLLNPKAHLFEITVTIDTPTPGTQQIALPSWTPGSYMIRDYAANIHHVHARCGKKLLKIQKIDKSAWEIDTECCLNGNPLKITYQVWAFDSSVRGAYLDENRGFINPAAVFMQPVLPTKESVQVYLEAPNIANCSNAFIWRVATSMPRAEGTELFDWGLYEASSYDELLEYPIEISDFEVISFNAGKASHHIIINDWVANFDANTLKTDVQRICQAEIEFFDPTSKRAPFNEYVFLLNLTGQAYGGLEHISSTALAAPKRTLPSTSHINRSDDYIDLLDLFAHEYFHAWLGRRINLSELMPSKTGTSDLYQAEANTNLLWVIEGFTSYYCTLFIRRLNLIDNNTYAKLLSKSFQNVLGRAAHLNQTLNQASFDAWISFYKPNTDTPNSKVNYYHQGALAALVLDAHIRQTSHGQYSLDDVLRELWIEYSTQNPDEYLGLSYNTLLKAFQRAIDLDLSNLIETLCASTNHLDYATFLAPLGISLTESELSTERKILGLEGKDTPEGFQVTITHAQELAEHVGISAGDILIAIDGTRIKKDNISQLLNRYSEGDTITIHAFRDDALVFWTLLLGKSKKINSTVKLDPTKLGTQWLQG